MSRKRSRGQALVETALVVPGVMALLVGAAQVGAITYSEVTVDTAAREGARVAAEFPNKSLDFVTTLGVSTYTCGQSPADAATEASVCDAVRSASGLISGSSLKVTVTVSSAISRVPDDVSPVGNTCPGGALATGTVHGLPSGQVATVASPSQATSGTVTSDSTGAYSICLSAPSHSQGTQQTTITATAMDGSGCTYGSSLAVSVSTSRTVSPSPADMTLPATGTCPATTTSTSATTTAPTSTSSTTTTTASTSTSTVTTASGMPTPAPAVACSSVVADTSFVRVTVSYRAPVFVPLVGRYFADSPSAGVHTVTVTQTMQVEPCSVTQGA